jgi:hypothetical protein
MPLIKKPSKKAFSENVKTEMNAGKPQNQSLAIAYDVKKRSTPKKKMAEGGIIDKLGSSLDAIADKMDPDKDMPSIGKKVPYNPNNVHKYGFDSLKAEGGLIEDESILEDNNEEQPNGFYPLNEHSSLEHNPDDAFMDMDQPEDSNLHGDLDEMNDSDKHDMISKIRRSMNEKRNK